MSDPSTGLALTLPKFVEITLLAERDEMFLIQLLLLNVA